MLLPNRLRELREARGLTLRELAEQVGTSNQQVSHLELGKRQLTTDWMARLAAVLGCHPWELVAELPSYPLSDREQQMLDNFRRLPLERQDSLIAATTPEKGASHARKRSVS